MAHPAAQQMAQAPSANANALQAPAQHMMQVSMGPHDHAGGAAPPAVGTPEPMSTAHLASSLSTDMDMDNVESSADSVVPVVQVPTHVFHLTPSSVA